MDVPVRLHAIDAGRRRTGVLAAGLGFLAVATVHSQPAQVPAKAPESAPGIQGEPGPKPPAPPAGVAAPARVEGPVYTWEDGDRTMRARLQPDLVVREDGVVRERDTFVARAGDRTIVRSESRTAEGGQPVFRSDSGRLMTLPGGVVLILDPEWTDADRSAFFAANGVEMDRVSALAGIPGAWFVDTAPGFPSLHLANALAGKEGVEVSSPNWWTESVPR